MSTSPKANDRVEFMPSNSKIDQICKTATSFEEMRRQIKEEMVGIPAGPNREAGPRQPVFAADGRFSRVIYPYGNVRCEIFGASEAELDEQQRRIFAAYGR